MKKEFKALGGLISVEVETEGKDDNSLNKKVKKINVNDPDIPYEVRMKHILKQYMLDQKKWEKMAVYTKHLEEEVIRLKNALIINGYSDDGVIGTTKLGSVIQELQEKIVTLKKKNKELKKKDNIGKVIELENKLNHIYPERKYKIVCFKRVIKSQANYIEELQKILDEHDIPYHPKTPINDLENDDIDTIDENAVRNEND